MALKITGRDGNILKTVLLDQVLDFLNPALSKKQVQIGVCARIQVQPDLCIFRGVLQPEERIPGKRALGCICGGHRTAEDQHQADNDDQHKG